MAPGNHPGGVVGISSKELYSEKFYDSLNYDYSDLSNYHGKCNNIAVRGKTEEMIRMCERILSNLENSTVLNIANSSYDVCTLFNYWIYDTLTRIYGAEKTTEIEIAFSSLQLIWGYLNYNPKNLNFYKTCKPNFDIVNHSDWKQRKELYDYCINYDLIGPLCKNFDEKCMQYYQYIKEKSSLYEHFEKICTPEQSNCPQFYEKCKAHNPTLVLPTLICHEKFKSDDPPEEATDLKTSAGHEFQPGAHVPGTGVPELAVGPDTGLTKEHNDIGKTVGHSVLGIAPVLLSATALYRYTPVGSWIRKLGGYNINGMTNMDGVEIDEFSSYTQEPGDMLFGGNGNYISYQPM
ncbi:PIR Superfamily Protein [Plasmodium ovale curtisi]|uniref:PIR Superfamily Protein n=1 Tax=Plasmodium ovale curtisi TaxID=864141 RepID=A0A1A8WPU3_PLAOA|nr:PIR Superfamily Protein [Plasmodium ovale curtisi]